VIDIQKVDDAAWAASYVRYQCEGDQADCWATEELTQLVIDNPRRSWKLINEINAISVKDEVWRKSIRASVGCGALEDLIVLHEGEYLPVILEAAKTDDALREELSAIYESSVRPELWAKLQNVISRKRD
jgi:hypothetical protein